MEPGSWIRWPWHCCGRGCRRCWAGMDRCQTRKRRVRRASLPTIVAQGRLQAALAEARSPCWTGKERTHWRGRGTGIWRDCSWGRPGRAAGERRSRPASQGHRRRTQGVSGRQGATGAGRRAFRVRGAPPVCKTHCANYGSTTMPGVLIHGMGRQGKSSLAARVANQLHHHEPVVVFKRYDAPAI